MHIQTAEPEPANTPDPPRKANIKRVAVLACHGMGQQLCYETIDSVATAICHQTGPENGWLVAEDPRVRVAQLGDHQLGRVEMRLCHKESERVVHIYEAYWAPLTQGRICLSETIAFLFRAGLDGMKHWAVEKGCFKWRVFADNRKDAPVQKEKVNAWLPFQLALLISGIALALYVGISILTFAVAWSLHVAGAPSRFCTGLAAAVILLGVAVAVTLLAVLASGLAAAWKDFFSFLGRHYTAVGLTVNVLCAIVFCCLPFSETAFLTVKFGQLQDTLRELLTRGGGMLCFVLSPALLYIWSLVRAFVLGFVGDVAIYVSANNLNRFWEVREDIRRICSQIARVIYEEKQGDQRHAYDEIIVLGHSLGSVVAYHALNSVLVADGLRPSTETMNVAERTSLFLTFGSPLDKIAYLFRAQAAAKPHGQGSKKQRPEHVQHSDPILDEDSTFREALDGAFAPLASCSVIRSKIPWTNIWASRDKISGRLNYFDPEPDKRRLNDPPIVYNTEEEAANHSDPISAHTQYWSQPKFGRAVFNAITKGKVFANNAESKTAVTSLSSFPIERVLEPSI